MTQTMSRTRGLSEAHRGWEGMDRPWSEEPRYRSHPPFMPGVWGVLVSNSVLFITRAPSYFHFACWSVLKFLQPSAASQSRVCGRIGP